MNELGVILVWCAVQVTVLSLIGAVLYLLVRWIGPAAGSFAALAALLATLIISALAFSPWPRWSAGNRQSDPPTNSKPIEEARAPIENSADDSTTDAAPAQLASWALPNPSVPSSSTSNSWLSLATETWNVLQATLADEPARTGFSWRWPGVLALGLLAGIGLGLLRFASGLLAVRRYRRHSQPISDTALADLLVVLQAEMGCVQPVELRTSPELTTAATIGWRRPLILLPADWTGWTAAEQRAILAHELAHIRRGDYLAWLAAQLCVMVHFYHPLVHWLAARLRLSQELAADAAAAQLAGGPRPYLTTLAQVALRQSNRSLGWPARCFLPTRGMFLRRIDMLRSMVLAKQGSLSRRLRLTVSSVLVLSAFGVAGLRAPGAGLQEGGGSTPPAPPGLRLDYVPPEAALVAAFSPAATARSADLAPLFKAIAEASGFQKELGLPLEDLEQATVVWHRHWTPPHAAPVSAIVLRATRPHDWKPIAQRWVPEPEEARLGGKTYFRSSRGRGLLCFYQPDPQTVIIAFDFDFADFFLTDAHQKQDQPWSDVWRQVAPDAVAAFAADGKWLRGLLGGLTPGAAQIQQVQLERARAEMEALRAAEAAALARNRLRQQHQEGPAPQGGAQPPRPVQPPPVPAMRPGQSEWGIIGASLVAPLWTNAAALGAGLSFKDRARLTLVARCDTEPGAESLSKTLEALVTLGRNALMGARAQLQAAPPREEMGMLRILFELGDQGLSAAKVTRTGAEVQMEASIDFRALVRTTPLVPAIMGVRVAARRAQSMNNLKQIGLAFHNYHSVYGHFPAADGVGPDGKTPVSWRVLILPFIEQEPLYRQYNQNEPWDSPSNRKVLEQMPMIYQGLSSDEKTTSPAYFVLTGRETLFPPGQGVKLQDVTDGTSMTIAAVEAKRNIPWTKPEDIPYAADKPLPTLGGFSPQGFNALIADGSVRFIATKADEQVLRAMITRAGGEVINFDALDRGRQ